MQAPPTDSRKQFRRGVAACIPTLLGYLAVGLACGAIGKVAGFNSLHIILAALFLYSGSAQFLFYSLLQTGAGIIEIVFAIAFINMRYLLINTYLSQFFKSSSAGQKLIGGLLISDETFGVASDYANRHGELPFFWLLGLNLTAWASWVAACVAGYFFAAALPQALLDGLSFSLVGMFIGLLLMSFFISRTKMLDCLTILTSMALVLFGRHFMPDSFIMMLAPVVSAALAMLLLMQLRKKTQRTA